jgi:HEAT repeat protein
MGRRRLRRRTKAERLAARGDVRRLARLLKAHDWLVDADGQARDLAVGQRLEAVAALGTVEGAEAEAALVQALRDDDPRVLQAAVIALGPDASDKAARTLARAAATWRDPSLAQARQSALDVLVAMDDEIIAIVFAEALAKDDQREHLNDTDENDLRRLFDRDKGPASEVLADRLAERLSLGDAPARNRAHQVLVTLGGVAVPPLVDALSDPARRQSACAALAAIRDPRAVPALCGILQHGDGPTRAMAAQTLGAIRDPRALEDLVRAGNDSNPDVRDAALDALDRLGSLVEVLGAAAIADSLDTGVGRADGPPRSEGRDGLLAQPGRNHRTLRQRFLSRVQDPPDRKRPNG